MSQKKEDEGFRVVDRRRFTNEGERRGEDIGHEDKAETANRKESAHVSRERFSEKTATAVNETSQGTVKTAEHSMESGRNESGVDFSGLVISLATQAMMMMGEIPHPETNLTSTNFDAARETIDLLAMLQEKTKGNLNETEARLMVDALASLRLAFVRKVQGGATKPAGKV